MIYYPNGYNFIKIYYKKNQPTLKVFGCFGDSWKLNSGVVDILEEKGEYLVKGYSGSTYVLRDEDGGHVSLYCSGVFSTLLQRLEEKEIPYQLMTLQEAIDFIKERD